MTDHRIRHVPVVKDEAMVSIVSIGDVVKYRISQLQSERDHLADYLRQSVRLDLGSAPNSRGRALSSVSPGGLVAIATHKVVSRGGRRPLLRRPPRSLSLSTPARIG